MDLAEVKQISLTDLSNFLQKDQTSFTTLSVSCKHIESTNRISVTLSKPSAKVFYLNSAKNPTPKLMSSKKNNPTDDCLQDAQNCVYFSLFNSTEKKLYTRFKDKVEANFEGTDQPNLFLTLTFNTTHVNLATWTTNWKPTDNCWQTLQNKKAYDLISWAQKFDQEAEPMKILIQKVAKEQARDLKLANLYVAKFLRAVRTKWKPTNWKWVIVAELQKRGVWHFHLLSTPIVPYAHKCTLSKDFTACWNCRTYLSELWPWGRVESRSPGKKTISQYLAKYLSKSFHLRSLYRDHGMEANHKTYRFFKNLYGYEEREVIISGKSRVDKLTNQPLNGNQRIFKKADNTYFYRTREKLIGKCSKPVLIKKNYRLSNHCNANSLLNLANKSTKKEVLNFPKAKLKKSTLKSDFQEFLITNLLRMCQKAEFLKIPLEAEEVPKAKGVCNTLAPAHFQTNSVFHFTFLPEQAPLIRKFIEQLDDHALDYDLTESKEFYFYPTAQTTKAEARNWYLNRWTHQISDHQPNNYHYANY